MLLLIIQLLKLIDIAQIAHEKFNYLQKIWLAIFAYSSMFSNLVSSGKNCLTSLRSSLRNGTTRLNSVRSIPQSSMNARYCSSVRPECFKNANFNSIKCLINPFQRRVGSTLFSFDHRISFNQGFSLSSAKIRPGLVSLIGSNHFASNNASEVRWSGRACKII